MTSIAVLFAGLKRQHIEPCPRWYADQGAHDNGKPCDCGMAEQHARVDAVAAEVSRRDEEQRAVIAAMGTALDEPDPDVLAIVDGGMKLTGDRAYYLGLAAVLKSSLMHARQVLADPAHARAIEEHRAMVAVVEAIEKWDAANSGAEAGCSWSEYEQALVAYRAARGTR